MNRKTTKTNKKEARKKEINFIGEGTYGSVIVENNLAVKKFWDLSRLLQEYCALIRLEKCDNIVKAKTVNLKDFKIGMELYDMDLNEWIKKNPKDEKTFLKLFKSFLKGLIYLHDQGLVHADIKPGNILVNIKDKKCVVADCGFVSMEPNDKCKLTAARYRDPKILRRKSHDMYSCGIILIEYFGTLNKFNSISELIKSAERIQNYRYKKSILEELEDCKLNKKNPYKSLIRLSKKLCNHECKGECPKDIIMKIVDKCKRMEYDNVMRSAYKIQNKKISQIAINLVQSKHIRRINSRKLYFELYDKKIINFQEDNQKYNLDTYHYQEEFKNYLDKILKNLLNENDLNILKDDENYKNYKRLWKDMKKLFFDNRKKINEVLTNKTINRGLNAYLKNLNTFDNHDKHRLIVLSVYIASCLYNRGIVGEYLIMIILNSYNNDEDFWKDLYILINNKNFINSLYY